MDAYLRINFWTGVFMLALGLLFLLWVWLRPLHVGAAAGVRSRRRSTAGALSVDHLCALGRQCVGESPRRVADPARKRDGYEVVAVTHAGTGRQRALTMGPAPAQSGARRERTAAMV